MKSRFDLSEVESFFVEKYEGTITFKENGYVQISFPNGVFITTEEEKLCFKRFGTIVSDINEHKQYLGVSFVISDDEIKEITFFGQNFHLYCLISVLFKLERPKMDDEQSKVFDYACSEIKSFFNFYEEL